jgi:hypothetical protein
MAFSNNATLQSDNLNSDQHGLLFHLIVLVLRLALVLSLFAIGWAVYRELPEDKGTGPAANRGETSVTIVLRSFVDRNPADVPVDLYPVDFAAVQHEFLEDPHPGVQFNDYLARRMKGRTVVKAHLDQSGQATVSVTPGKWWLQATLPGNESIEWRLAVNVAGHEQTIELTPENAYAHMKTF